MSSYNHFFLSVKLLLVIHRAPGAPRERSTEAVASPEEALGMESCTNESSIYDAYVHM